MPKKKTSASTLSAVAVGEKVCRPFILEFKLAAPEAGFRISVGVEKACTAENDPIWKLVFDLFKKVDGKFEQIVHVSFKAGTDDERKGVETIAAKGLSKKAAKVMKEEVFPTGKQLENKTPTEEQKAKLKSGMSKVTLVSLE